MGPKAAYELLAADRVEWNWTPDEWYRERNLLNNQ